MSIPSEPPDRRPVRGPAEAAVLRRVRRAVEGVLAAALGLVLLGSLVPEWLPGAEPEFWGMDGDRLFRLSQSVSLGLVVLSVAVRRALGNRGALRDPSTRARQFFRAQVGAAVVGALSAPLGVIVALLLRPGPRELAPFWIAALGAILLAYPRGYELDDFEEPLPVISGE